MPEQHDNLAILFVDVSDSVRLYEALGDAAAYREVQQYLNLSLIHISEPTRPY